jgi:glycosyltransferase involved in cell wall biosynthesis
MEFSPEKITVIHNGVLCPKEPTPLAERPASAPLEILWAGRFVKQKRIDMLIDLIALSRQEHIPIHITLVGDGPLLFDMTQKVKEAGLEDQITFTGWKSDIKPYIDQADLYLSASNREGFPNTLLEVCACGRGCLVSDIPPNREVLGAHRAGFLLGDNLSDWTSILKRLYANREEIGILSREAFGIAQEFTIEHTCEKTAALYEKLIGSRR